MTAAASGSLMRKPSLVLALLLVLSPSAPPLAQEARRIETGHLIIEWEEGTLRSEIDAAKTEGERFHAAVGKVLGGAPKGKITVLLRGAAQRTAGEYPHVDPQGRINLFRFEPSGKSYFGALAHELVHAFRFFQRLDAGSAPDVQYQSLDWFFEEGLAEFVALRVDPSLGGFPWYDHPVTVVAGQWILGGDEIPLGELRRGSRPLIRACQAQAYSTLGSFFLYLGDRYGDGPLLEMARLDNPGRSEDYLRFFKKEFAALEADWREFLLNQYRKTDQADELARRYRQETPIQYQPVCKKGKEF